ncbi:ATP-binding protein [Lactobacillus acetotolerans]|uniref:ATPase domain-containing protein n=1 Tax=Lactobacillus acetotolerans TaxID=1600 RepID=A0A0D6A5T6_9LACO|nr:ATP-binding protein [Lactobacillus acetotolerans]KRN38092.1 hypothetical protein FC77_GL001215 [Lactobacillus acetotolerans DSM 20749 = JCM 3825]BAQ57800.1 conserved hypothetical protein [Lactobacillus acetotolerans]GGV18002.1 hypothetical protein GCM10011628_14160 [Lactobacillus acetotolerans DSM 20749 = JCM 3825]
MNPFNPSFGKVPTVFLDRNKLVNTVTKNLENPNSPYQTTLIYGLRGVGKTSFLTDVSKNVAKKKNWIVVNLVPNDKILPTLIEGIYKQSTPKLKKIFDKINGFKISAFEIEINGQKSNDASVSQIALETILEQLKQQNVHLLVTIDEVSSTPEIRNFASIYQIMVREEFYISLIMTGLPDQVSELQNDKVLTFLLRSKRITLSPLNKLDVKYRYREAFANDGRKISD